MHAETCRTSKQARKQGSEEGGRAESMAPPRDKGAEEGREGRAEFSCLVAEDDMTRGATQDHDDRDIDHPQVGKHSVEPPQHRARKPIPKDRNLDTLHRLREAVVDVVVRRVEFDLPSVETRGERPGAREKSSSSRRLSRGPGGPCPAARRQRRRRASRHRRCLSHTDSHQSAFRFTLFGGLTEVRVDEVD